MKKTLCLLLGLCILFACAGCGEKKTSSDEDGVDVAYFAKIGQMPESTYALGDSIEQIENDFTAAAESADEEHEPVYAVTEGERTVRINTGNLEYYYMKDKKSDGVSYIVNYGDSYGFEQGTISIEVKDALSEYDCDEHDATDNEVSFLPSAENCTVLTYTFGSNIVLFVFQDNALCATVLYNPALWTL